MTVRLTEQERRVIVEQVRKVDAQARCYLYGSRTNMNLKGGDIDLLVISEAISMGEKIDILIGIKEELGDQRIDLTVVASADSDDPFYQSIREGMVAL